MEAFVFFVVIGAIVIVPQWLRHQERQRVHDTIRECVARGQPVPPELFRALRWRRRVYTNDYGAYPTDYAAPQGYSPQGYAAPGQPAPGQPAPPPMGEPAAFAPDPVIAPPPPMFVGRPLYERDLRRGVTWISIGLGLIAAGAAFYAGLYYDGGAPEVFSSFAALGAIPLFVGLTYLSLWFFNRKSKA